MISFFGLFYDLKKGFLCTEQLRKKVENNICFFVVIVLVCIQNTCHPTCVYSVCKKILFEKVIRTFSLQILFCLRVGWILMCSTENVACVLFSDSSGWKKCAYLIQCKQNGNVTDFLKIHWANKLQKIWSHVCVFKVLFTFYDIH